MHSNLNRGVTTLLNWRKGLVRDFQTKHYFMLGFISGGARPLLLDVYTKTESVNLG